MASVGPLCSGSGNFYLLRALQPSLSEEFARFHDAGIWGCLCSILQLPVDQVRRRRPSHSCSASGLGRSRASQCRARTFAAFWASWANCLPMVYARHPDVAIQLALHLEGSPHTHCLSEVAAIPVTLSGVGLEVPTWRELMLGARAPPREPDDYEPGSQRAGWQHEAASRVDRHFRDDVLFTTLPSSTPMGGMALSATPTSMLTRIEPHLFRIVLLRQPLPLSARSCRCGRLLDAFGHHRAACARAGLRVLWPVFVGEAGGRVRTTVTVRDLDMGIPLVGDARRLEVVHLWVHCMLTGARGRERPMKTERLLLQRDVARNAPTRSWCARAAVAPTRGSGRRDWRSVVC